MRKTTAGILIGLLSISLLSSSVIVLHPIIPPTDTMPFEIKKAEAQETSCNDREHYDQVQGQCVADEDDVYSINPINPESSEAIETNDSFAVTAGNRTFGPSDLRAIDGSVLRASPENVVIDFEDSAGYSTVFRQYEDKGVIFNSPTVSTYPLSPNFAHSGINAIEQCVGAEFRCTTPITMTFTTPQKYLRVWIGYSSQLGESREVVLRALGTGSVEVGRATATLSPSDTNQPINIPLEVTSGNAAITFASVSFSDNSINTKGLVVDDVEFDTAGPSPVCGNANNPFLELYDPQDQKMTSINEFIISGRFSDGPLESAIVKVIGPDNQTRQSDLSALPSMGHLQEIRGYFGLEMANLLFPGKNTIQFEAENCHGRGSPITRTITFTPISEDTHLILSGIDVMQGNFIHDNSTPLLVPGTPTAIRAYLQVVGPVDELPNVSGSVLAYRPAETRPHLNLGKQLSPERVHSVNSATIDSLASMPDAGPTIESSLSFNLPKEWVESEGQIHLEFEFFIEESPDTKIRIHCEMLKPNLGALQCGNLDVYGYIDFVAFKKPPCIRAENGRCLVIGGGTGHSIPGVPREYDPWSGGNPPLSQETLRKIEEYKKEVCSPGNPYGYPEVRCPEVSYCKGAVKWSIFRTCAEIYPEWYTGSGQQSMPAEGQSVIDEFLKECTDDLTHRMDQSMMSESEYIITLEIMCSAPFTPGPDYEEGGPEEESYCGLTQSCETTEGCNPSVQSCSLPFFVQLPSSTPGGGDGYYTLGPDFERWGQQVAIDTLQDVAREWATRHPNHPGIGINDISTVFGGPFGPHKSHGAGMDTDVRLMNERQTPNGVTWEIGEWIQQPNGKKAWVGTGEDNPDYSRDLTRELIVMLRDTGHVKVIFFNDPVLIQEFPGFVKYSRNHHDHIHVRFR
jgi:hypothetical protein